VFHSGFDSTSRWRQLLDTGARWVGRVPTGNSGTVGWSTSVSALIVNVSVVLDGHQDVFIDGSHTNEEDAKIVAERLWQELRPRIDELYGR
jgi:hypothetical protein